jgi:hypothetical protein
MSEKIAIAAVLVVLGFGSGWMVNGWRLGEDLAAKDTTIARLQGANTALEAANKQCAVNVDAVQTAVKEVVEEAQKVNDKAVAAMNRAAGAAARHQKKAEEFLTASRVPPEQQCADIMKKQADYVEYRRGVRK